jgi:hypothetical protein
VTRFNGLQRENASAQPLAFLPPRRVSQRSSEHPGQKYTIPPMVYPVRVRGDIGAVVNRMLGPRGQREGVIAVIDEVQLERRQSVRHLLLELLAWLGEAQEQLLQLVDCQLRCIAGLSVGLIQAIPQTGGDDLKAGAVQCP